jgi:cytochrome c553
MVKSMSFRPFLGLAGIALAAAVFAQEASEEATAVAVVPVEEPVPVVSEVIAIPLAADGPTGPGDAARGESKAAVCAACHGMDGNSSNGEWPKLAGQHELYIARQLQLYKSGERENAVMLGFSATLSSQDMRDIGAFYAGQTVTPGVADEALVAKGQQVYRGGTPQTGVPACMACHGPSGRGNPYAGYPALAGQHADYTALMLRAYRDGLVLGEGDNANAVMAGVARMMTDEEIDAVSSFIEGLYSTIE